MPDSLPALEYRRHAIFQQMLALGDFRQGSVTTTQGPCGKPTCRCRQRGHPGHGPHWRLTYKSRGKTVTQSLSDPAARRKTQREITAFRRFQQLSRELIEVNEKICRLRPVEQESESAASVTPQEKKRPRRSNKKSPKKSNSC